MGLSKGIMLGFIVAGIFVVSSSVSSAAETKDEAFVKLLKDSAAVLQKSNPEIAGRLSRFSNEEANEDAKEKNDEINEKDEKTDQTKDSDREEHKKLLRDAAAALKQSHPDLAQSLTKSVDQEKKDDNEDQEETDEKDER